MALQKTIETDLGVPATYWHIGAVAEDFKGRGTEVTLYGYASRQARQAGMQPLSAGKIQFSGEDYVPGADRAELYDLIAKRPEFEGAESI